MENTSLNIDDDIFMSRIDQSITQAIPSTSRIHFPSPLDATSARQSRQFPEHLQKPYAMNSLPPVRRGSPLNPQKSTQRRSKQSESPALESPVLRQRRIPSPGIIDTPSNNAESELEIGVFSNEYDLYPRILLDVQRALKFKARREARLKREHTASPQNDSPVATIDSPSPASGLPQSKWKTQQSLIPSPPSSPTHPRKASTSTVSDIDFSPSTGIFNIPIHSHPVPSSLDNGMTLDWTASLSDEDRAERRWPISLGKRRDKDKMFPLGVMAEQQEIMHKEKVDRIRTIATLQTHRKAAITREQLEKRYKFLYDSIPPNKSPFDLLKVARWYGSLGTLLKQSLEKAEPFTWLKHLDKVGRRPSRLPWNLSALIMEEYLQAKNGNNHGVADYADTVPFDIGYSDGPSTNVPPNVLPRTVVPSEQHASSMPKLFDAKTGRNDESGGDVPVSGPSSLALLPLTTKESQIRPSANNGAKSDDVLSLNASVSSCSDSDMPKQSASAKSSHHSDRASFKETKIISVVPCRSLKQREKAVVIPLQLNISTSSKTSDGNHQSDTRQSLVLQPLASKRKPIPRRVRVSLPSATLLGNRKHSEENEALTQRVYEARARLLEEANAYNYRVRQMLNRISAAVKEYDSIQGSSRKPPGISRSLLPRDLVDAFNHDPAAVTGSTRRLQGWRAVEDIHQRLARQRDVFRTFLSKSLVEIQQGESILDDPVAHLIETLDVLEVHNDTIVSTANVLSDLLQSVQRTHGRVKSDYNDTLSHTSVLYPELSHIIALEESYRDQYQQFWDFGMDALTFLLDTVTPFWRTYGKTIGKDVRDFLIIPLYRNEFTGETKRYRLKEIPRRSVRHWLGLITFFIASIGVNLLQLRAAVTSLLHCRLHWIPYEGVRWTALPFFWIGILIQWTAVIVEFVIVFMQLSVIAWWTCWSISIFH